MLKVILIDDEAIILRGLKKLIDWNLLGYEIVGEALDGSQGLELIKTLQPDVVISDIMMPGMSGLSMLKELDAQNINTKVIFLSGYKEFSYACEAVRYGALDYLLKPVSAEELSKVLTRVLDQIVLQRSYHVLKKKDSRAQHLLQDILYEKTTKVRLFDIAKMLNLENYKQGMVCFGLRILFRKDVLNAEENLNLKKYEIYEYIDEYLEENQLGCILKKDYSSCYCLLVENHDCNQIKTQIEKLENKIQSKYLVELITGVGAWSDLEGKLQHVYSSAKFALELYYFLEKRYIDYDSIKKDYTHSLEEYQQQVKKLLDEIINHFNTQQLIEEIKSCLVLLGNIHYGNKNAVVNSCIQLSGEIYATLKECGLIDESYKEEQAEFLEKIKKKVSLHFVISLFEEYYEQTFLKIRLLKKYTKSSEIVRIKSYIKTHFRENISLEDIASYIGMNATYLSVFFKKETGQNFKVYLTQVRLKEALRLLNSTDMKSYEVALAIGYKDDKQFREKFKEIYGMSPKQYRDSQR